MRKPDLSGLKSSRLLGGAAVLAIGSVAAKLIGAFYRIPLTNILGAEGMGMYQLVFPVYALFMTMSSAGIPTALSRIVAEKRAMGEGAKKYLVSALLSLLLMTSIAVILTVSLSEVLATSQGNAATASGYIVIAPSVLFVGVIAGLRGWFQGEMYMLPTALSNVVEQIVKLAAGITLAVVLAPYGLTASVCGALAGITVSELVAAVYLAVTYFVRERKGVRERLRVNRVEARDMFKVAFPIAFVAVLLPLSNFFDSLIIVNVLKWGGAGTGSATADYGLISGPVASLVNMPVVIIMSLAVAIVPSVSMSRVSRDIGGIMLKSRLSLKLVYMLGVPAALFFMVFARPLLGLLYPALSPSELATGANLLLIMSPNVVMLSAMQIFISLLQGLDRTVSAVKCMVAAIAVKIGLSILLVRLIGVEGAAVASTAMAATALFALNLTFKRLTSMRIEKNIAQTMLAGVIMALVGVVVLNLVPGYAVKIAVGLPVCAAVYIYLVMLFGVFSESEFTCLPFGRALNRLRKAIRFWEYEKDNGS